MTCDIKHLTSPVLFRDHRYRRHQDSEIADPECYEIKYTVSQKLFTSFDLNISMRYVNFIPGLERYLKILFSEICMRFVNNGVVKFRPTCYFEMDSSL